MEEHTKYNFITGLPRAGTTLLSSELNKYPTILVLPESKHVLKLLRGGDSGEKLETYYKKVKQKIHNTPYELSDEISDVIKSSGKNTIRENSISIGKCFSFFGISKNPTIIVDKNPIYCFHFDEIIKSFPDAKFVLMLRNPSAFVLSLTQKKNNKNKIQSPWYFAYVWNNFTSQIISFSKKHPDKVLVLKYEELVSDKENFTRIANFFGEKNKQDYSINFDSDYINFIKNSNFNERLKTKYLDLSKPINKERVYAYKTTFSEAKIRRIESICSKNMKVLGYQKITKSKSYIQNIPYFILGKMHKIRAKQK